jgi:hypothetical protein
VRRPDVQYERNIELGKNTGSVKTMTVIASIPVLGIKLNPQLHVNANKGRRK